MTRRRAWSDDLTRRVLAVLRGSDLRGDRSPEAGWIEEERFTDFRRAIDYARGHFSRAAYAHAKVNREEAYWIWKTIQRGFEVQEREVRGEVESGDP